MADLAGSQSRSHLRLSRSRTARALYIGAGGALVGIGVLGIFLPLLPTTVFLLLAAACFARSSERAHAWLMTNRYFGSYLHNYREHHGATRRSKLFSIVALWAGIGASVVLFGLPIWVDAVLVVIAVAVTWHLARLRTITR